MNRREKMIAWLGQFEQYAKTQGLSMRILDSAKDARERLEQGIEPDQEFCREIEEILESAEHKAKRAGVAQREKEAGGVSVEQVREQMKKMAERCHGENQDSLTGVESKTNITIRECARKMEEITHADAHLDLFSDEKKYLDFFEKIKSGYERDMAMTARALIEAVGSNYNYMADHLRSMFQSIGGRENGVGSEKFYREYEEKKEYLEKRLEGEARTANFGSGSIAAFAKKTWEGVWEIVQKAKKKKIVFCILPLLILGVFLLAGADFSEEKEPAYESSALEDYLDENFGEGAGEVAGIVKDYAMDKASEGIGIFGAVDAVSDGVSTAINSVKLFFALLLIVIYVFYLKIMDKRYKRQICAKCGGYLKPELEEWERQGLLLKSANQTLAHLAQECEGLHIAALNNIFDGTKYAETEPDETDLEKLRREWETLK